MIVNHLSRELGARHMSIKDLQRASGVSYSTLHPLVNDQVKRLDLATLDSICAALDCQPGELFEYRRAAREPRAKG